MGKAVQGGVLMEGEGGEGDPPLLWFSISLVYYRREGTPVHSACSEGRETFRVRSLPSLKVLAQSFLQAVFAKAYGIVHAEGGRPCSLCSQSMRSLCNNAPSCPPLSLMQGVKARPEVSALQVTTGSALFQGMHTSLRTSGKQKQPGQGRARPDA